MTVVRVCIPADALWLSPAMKWKREMELIEKETLILVGLPVAAHWRDLWVEMPKAWQTLFSRIDEIPLPHQRHW